jgi:hypothetical protein
MMIKNNIDYHMHCFYAFTSSLCPFYVPSRQLWMSMPSYDWVTNAVMCSTNAINLIKEEKAAAIFVQYAGPNR